MATNKELGLNVDMLDVDRLRSWSRLIDVYETVLASENPNRCSHCRHFDPTPDPVEDSPTPCGYCLNTDVPVNGLWIRDAGRFGCNYYEQVTRYTAEDIQRIEARAKEINKVLGIPVVGSDNPATKEQADATRRSEAK